MTTRISLGFALLATFAALTTGCAGVTEDDVAQAPEQEQTGETSSALRISTTLNADGDACIVRTNPDGTTVPGTVKGLECCSKTDTSDCVVILKPFPSSFSMR